MKKVAPSGTIVVREGVELVNETLGMDPTQGIRADFELTGFIADDYCLGQQAGRLDAAAMARAALFF